MAFFETSSGARIHYETKGAGRPLVFIHGWAMSGRVWRYQVEMLAGSWQVIVPDLRGHGHSSTAEACSISDCAADIVELIVQLELDNAVLIGWSMGAQIALQASSLLRERLAALVLVDGTAKFTSTPDYQYGLPAEEARGMTVRLRRNFTRTMEDFFTEMFAEGEITDESRERIGREVVAGGNLPDPLMARLALDSLASADFRSLLAGVELPVLLIHGSRDSIMPPAAAGYLAKQMPRATLKIIEGAGHAPFLSRPEECNALLCAFLEEVYGSD